jgi:VCBS repeat protein/FG-GAP repeat protein
MKRSHRRRIVLAPSTLEDRINPVSFSTLDDYWIGGNVMSVAVGDFNGDGHNDIAAGNGGNGVEILLNDGTGEFVHGETLPIAAPFHVELADLNADGKLDIYVANEYGQSLYTALGKGDGTFQVPVGYQFTNNARSAAAADFNGDGKLDIVVADSDGAAVFINNGSASLFGTPTFYHPDPAAVAFAVAAGDFNGDGKADFAIAQSDGKRLDVFLNHGDGTFGAPTHYDNLIPNFGRTLLTRDFNNDGILDLMAGYDSSSYLGLYFGNGDGTFRSPVGVNTSLTRNGPFTTADFNLDGKLDIAVMRGGDGDEVVLLGDGAGGFSLPTKVIDSWSGYVEAGDVNGDGRPDIVTGHSLSPGEVTISINTTPIVLSFEISAPASVHPGDSFLITVTAKNASDAIKTNYNGTVHFTSTDPNAVLPVDAHLTNGVGTFSVTLTTAGIRTITVADTATGQSATTGPIEVTNAQPHVTPPIFAKFGLGLYRTTAPRGWKVVSTMNAERFVVSADGLTVVADFGRNGLWRRNDSGWLKLTDSNAESAAVSRDGTTVLADFGKSGLKLWTQSSGWASLAAANVESARLSSDGQVVVADFGNGGMRRWVAGSGWTTLTQSNAVRFVIDAGGQIVVGDFGPGGLWRWNATANAWLLLSNMSAERVVISGDGSAIVADFGANGLRRWTQADGWVTLSPLNAESISISYDGQTVLADFGASGLRRWKQFGGWTTLTTTNVENAVLSSDGFSVVVDFGPGGLRLYETGWTLLSALNPEQIAIG